MGKLMMIFLTDKLDDGISPQTSGWNIGKNKDGKERFPVKLFEGDLVPQTPKKVLQKEKKVLIRN